MTDTPTAYQLEAALLSARTMAADGATIAVLRASYDKAITGGIFRARDLEIGHELLVRLGLVTVVGDRFHPTAHLLDIRQLPDDVACEVLLQESLAVDTPLWLYAAVVDDGIRWENIPDDDGRALSQLIASPERREAMLLALGRLVEQQRLKEVGREGEEAVVDACRAHLFERDRPDLASGVRRVSARSDQLGYDVTAPDISGQRHRIEVKTSHGMPGEMQFYLSRNEVTVGLRDSMWSLVAVRRSVAGNYEVVGWCRATDLKPCIPKDGHYGRWESVRVVLPDDAFQPGLPLDASF